MCKTRRVVVVIVVVTAVCHVLFLRGNYASLSHIGKSKLGICNESSIPVGDDIISKIREWVQMENLGSYRLVDFGCGDGGFLRKTHDLFRDAHGVEIDARTAQRASEKLEDLKNVRIVCADMLDYSFERTPTVLFMYEPLWNCSKEFAQILYDIFFSSKAECIDYILYVTGALRSDVHPEPYGFEEIRTFSHGPVFFRKTCRLFRKINVFNNKE